LIQENAMRQPQLYTSWLITCHSPEESQTLQRWLADRIDLNRVLFDMIRSGQNGGEQVESIPHRLGDYFAAIQVLPPPTKQPSSFRLVFHRLSAASRFWKDLMVNLIREIEATSEEKSIQLDYKGDEEPVATTATH